MFDVQAWLADPALGFTEEEQTALLPQFSTAGRVKALEGNQLRQSDYSKQMNDGKAALTTAQAKVDETDAKLNRELAEWSKVQGAGTAAQAAAVQRIATLEQQVLTGRQRVEQIAQAAALDPVEYLKGLESSAMPPAADLPPAPPGASAADPPDLSAYVKTTDVAVINDYLFQTTMALPGIAAEHLALTGEPLDTQALGVEIQKRAAAKETFSPRDVWEGMHDIPAKRVVAEKKTYDAAIDAAVARGREAALSESALPVGAPAGKHAVIFQPNGEGKSHESKLERPQPRTRTTSAVQALVAHTYRPEQTGAPGGATG